MPYVPPFKPGTEARLRAVSARRGRLYAGGTYFRSKDIGQAANKISIRVVEFSGTDAVCVVQNDNIVSSEIVSSPVAINVISLSLDYNEKIEITSLTAPLAAATKYSISAQIAPPPPIVTPLGNVKLSNFFNIPSHFSGIMPPDTSVFTPSDKIIITPRTRVYRLQPLSGTDPETGSSFSGWDIADLRTQINASDPWIEMPERGTDAQDLAPATDSPVLSAFSKTYLSGGDGVPTTPSNENTGPSKALIFVAYSEGPDGAMRDVAEIREWVGESASSGEWRPYQTA